jgi:hypothetical protein
LEVIPLIVDVQPYLDHPESYTVTVGELRLGVVMRLPVGGNWRTVPPLAEYPDRNEAVEALVTAWQKGELPDVARA